MAKKIIAVKGKDGYLHTKEVEIKPEKVSAEIVAKNFEKQAKPIRRRLEALKITNADSREKARELTKLLKDLSKEADRQLKEITDPIKEGIKRIENFFKPFQAEVAEIEAEVKRQILIYDERAEQKKLALDNKFATGKVSATTYLKKSGDLEDTKGSRSLWKATPVNEALTPREYLVPDIKRIEQALKSGEKVKGWELKQTKTIAI